MGFNTRIKSYPNGSFEILACRSDIWERDIYHPSVSDSDTQEHHKKAEALDPIGSRARAISRARAKLRDYAMCSHFTHFLTLTYDPARVDSFNEADVIRKTTQWADNQYKRHGMTYLLVPERHQSGRIHFHGLIDCTNVKILDSGTISGIFDKPARPHSDAQRAEWLAQGGHIVWNVPGWRNGFSTAIELYGEYDKAVSYVCKYIGKQTSDGGLVEKIGGRWYYGGGDLRQPEVTYTNMSADELSDFWDSGYQFSIPDAGLEMCMVRG